MREARLNSLPQFMSAKFGFQKQACVYLIEIAIPILGLFALPGDRGALVCFTDPRKEGRRSITVTDKLRCLWHLRLEHERSLRPRTFSQRKKEAFAGKWNPTSKKYASLYRQQTDCSRKTCHLHAGLFRHAIEIMQRRKFPGSGCIRKIALYIFDALLVC